MERLIEALEEISTKNSISHYKRGVCRQAVEAIRMLRAELEQVKRERDAAAADIKALLQKADYVGVCWACKYGNTDCGSDNCGEAEWRGPEAE